MVWACLPKNIYIFQRQSQSADIYSLGHDVKLLKTKLKRETLTNKQQMKGTEIKV